MGRRGAWIVAGVVVVAVLAGVAIGAAVFGSDDRGGASGPTSTTTGNFVTTTAASPSTGGGVPPPPTVDTDGLEGEALALAQAINRAAGLTYHAVFEAATGGQTSGSLRVEVWRRPPLARRQSALSTATATIETIELRLEDEMLGCVRLEPDTPFECADNPDPEADPSAPVFGSVDPHAGVVTARDDEIDGVAVRCYIVIPTGAATQEACFDADGVPVVVDGGDGRLDRTLVDTNVPDEIFSPPTG